MKKVTKEILKESAQKLMFEMSEEQYENILNEFDLIYSQMKIIGEIEGVDEVEPMFFPFDVTNDYLREDVPTTPIERKELLRNTKDVENGFISLPRVVK